MAGRMGGDRVTTKNLLVYKVDPEHNLVYVRGSVPGANKSWIRITDAKSAKFEKIPPFPTHIRKPDDDLREKVHIIPKTKDYSWDVEDFDVKTEMAKEIEQTKLIKKEEERIKDRLSKRAEDKVTRAKKNKELQKTKTEKRVEEKKQKTERKEQYRASTKVEEYSEDYLLNKKKLAPKKAAEEAQEAENESQEETAEEGTAEGNEEAAAEEATPEEGEEQKKE